MIRADVQVDPRRALKGWGYPQHLVGEAARYSFPWSANHGTVVVMGDLVQLSLFTVSTVDPPWRDNRDAMAYPLLSLQKRRTAPIKYERNGVSIGVHAPAEFGIASIWDWDLIIFAASHLNQAIEDGRKPAPRISFVPYDCLKQLRRPIGGAYYKKLAEAVRRLRATTIITNIRFEDAAGEDDDVVPGEERPFSWLTDYRLPKKYRRRVYTTPDKITHITPQDHKGEPDPAQPWEIKLSPWLYRAIVRQRDLLAVHPDYFLLTGGIERWLYRLARKAVPEKTDPPEFRYRLQTLFEVSGLTGRLRDFRAEIERITAEAPLPEYGVRLEHDGRHELVTLCRDHTKPGRMARSTDAIERVISPPPRVTDVMPEPPTRSDYDPRDQEFMRRLAELCEGRSWLELTFPGGDVFCIHPQPGAGASGGAWSPQRKAELYRLCDQWRRGLPFDD